jgi:hypothetical protein
MSLAAGLTDRGGQAFQLIGMTANDDSRITLAGKSPGDRAAQGVARADHDDRFFPHADIRCVGFRHGNRHENFSPIG